MCFTDVLQIVNYVAVSFIIFNGDYLEENVSMLVNTYILLDEN